MRKAFQDSDQGAKFHHPALPDFLKELEALYYRGQSDLSMIAGLISELSVEADNVTPNTDTSAKLNISWWKVGAIELMRGAGHSFTDTLGSKAAASGLKLKDIQLVSNTILALLPKPRDINPCTDYKTPTLCLEHTESHIIDVLTLFQVQTKIQRSCRLQDELLQCTGATSTLPEDNTQLQQRNLDLHRAVELRSAKLAKSQQAAYASSTTNAQLKQANKELQDTISAQKALFAAKVAQYRDADAEITFAQIIAGVGWLTLHVCFCLWYISEVIVWGRNSLRGLASKGQ